MIKYSFLTAIAVLGSLAIATAPAQAQANLVFSGGNGTPLTISLTSPVTYTVTKATRGVPYFTFDAVGLPAIPNNPVASGYEFVGSWTYSINGAAPVLLDELGTDYSGGNTTADDLFIGRGLDMRFAVGNTVTLNATTITTRVNIPGATPVSGTYHTFVGNLSGTTIATSNAAVVVPEANSAALLGLTLPMMGAVLLKRRKN